ncbi:MAG: fimbrillin family protein [Bacteroidales bacterium]|nr:fimbrillin family protein [Bacteroidales bacterium]
MRKIEFLTLAVAAAMLTVGCNKSVPESRKTISIDPLITRATETDFEQGDKIGVAILRGEDYYVQNECFTYNGQSFTSDLFWYTDGEQQSTFLAYYPYSEQGVPTTFTVAADQSDYAAYTASDLMAAVKEGVVPQASVTMPFKHMLTRIVLKINNEAEVKVKKVTLKNSILAADVDAQMHVVPAQAEARDIIMHKQKADVSYCALVIPQSVSFATEIELENGKVLKKTLTEVSLKQGGQYSINAVILPEDVEVNISGDIENWEDEGEITEKEISFHEYDKYFEYDGINYTTAVLPDGNKWMTQNLAFLPEGKKVSSTPGDNAGIWYPYAMESGAAVAKTDDATIKANGYLYDAKTFLGVESVTVENCTTLEGVQGICPEGWHIPTRMELINLCGAATVKYGDETDNPTNTDAPFWDANLKYGTIVKANECGWNYVFCGSIANNKYNAVVTKDTTTDVEEYLDKLALSVYAGSTGHATGSTPSPKVSVMQSTFTSTYKKGRLSVADSDAVKAAAAVRCVKNK